MFEQIFKIVKMDNSVLVKHADVLEVNPCDAEKATAARLVEVLENKPFPWAKKYIVYGEMNQEEAIDAVIKHSGVVASAYSSKEIDLTAIVVEEKSISRITAADELKEHYYPIIITA